LRRAGIAAVLVLLARTALPQAATASLEVTLRGAIPAERSRVRLTTPAGEREGAPDAHGRVVFPHLRPGAYRLEVLTPAGPCGGREIAVGDGEALHVGIDCAVAEAPPAALRHPRLDRATRFPAADLRALPRPADPWSALRDVPGVAVDRVNVGGSETAQQSLLVAYGDAGAGAAWTLDGADVTDPAAVGFSSIYPDMDALESLEARSGSLDARVRTPGVQVRLALREPAARFGGGAHVRIAPEALQWENLPPALASRNFLRNRTDHVAELGGEAGARLRDGRLWLWGAAHLNQLRQETFTEHAETLRTTSFAAKARLRLGRGALSLLALRAEKVHEDRDTGFSAAPEARWRQSGPTYLVALEDQRSLGSWSMLSRLSYLDAGFRLDPQGGILANAFEDARGVFQGSYQSFTTERERLQVGLEAVSRRRALGADHDIVLGAGYRRMPVDTLQGWPGNQTLGLARQDVFFRAFRLTGFALPTRDLHARSVHDHLELFAQDSVRWGRLSMALGVRLDRLAGHNRSSSVEANPVFPDLLPAAIYPGGPTEIEWLDVLPRAGVSWDVTGKGTLLATAGYAAYGAALGSSEVTFDNPLAQGSSLTFYWVDRNADNSVQANELDTLRGRLGASGLDPARPASATSPNAIDPDLKSPRTHEVAASLDASFGPALGTGLRFSFRRLTRALWRPLRGLELADYAATGSVRGELFGTPYDVTYFAPASTSLIVPGNGRVLTNREGYAQDAVTVELRAGGRIGAGVRWRGWGAYSFWYERFTDFTLAIQDPTPLDTEPLQDLGRLTVRPGGLGRGDVFVNARWTAGGSVAARLPARIDVAANASARDGFPIPYFQVGNTGDPTGAAKSVLIAPHVDSYRLPALVLVDARIARGFALGRGTLTAAADVFNLLNVSTTLQVARDIELPAFDRPREIVRPRIVRLGLEYRF
jgi:hypothetical protein